MRLSLLQRDVSGGGLAMKGAEQEGNTSHPMKPLQGGALVALESQPS